MALRISSESVDSITGHLRYPSLSLNRASMASRISCTSSDFVADPKAKSGLTCDTMSLAVMSKNATLNAANLTSLSSSASRTAMDLRISSESVDWDRVREVAAGRSVCGEGPAKA